MEDGVEIMIANLAVHDGGGGKSVSAGLSSQVHNRLEVIGLRKQIYQVHLLDSIA